MRRLATLPGLCLALAACAETGSALRVPAPQERGYRLAQTQCAICHDAQRSGGPTDAPPFAELGRRFNVLTFERRIREIAAGAHYDMPAVYLTSEQAADIAAYMAALNAGPAPCKTPVEAPACSR